MAAQVHEAFVGGDSEEENQRAADQVPDVMGLQVPRRSYRGARDPDRRVVNLSVHGCLIFSRKRAEVQL